MNCSNCGQEIQDKSPSCPYCGKIFISQRAGADKKPIVASMPVQEAPADTPDKMSDHVDTHHPEVHKAVKLRRKQRWFFYIVIIVLFLGAVALLVKTMNDNSNLLNQLNTSQTELVQSKTSLEAIKKNLSESDQRLQSADANLKDVQDELARKISDMETLIEESGKVDSIKANLKNVILDSGIYLSKEDMKKIALANTETVGDDTDGDELSDEMERALGTDKNEADSDSDGYNDKDELLQGFNPMGNGNMGVDSKFTEKYKNRIVLEEKDVIYAWYVAESGERYYLGNSGDNFKTLSNDNYWSQNR